MKTHRQSIMVLVTSVAALGFSGSVFGDVVIDAVGEYDSDSNPNAVDRVADDSVTNGGRVITTMSGYEQFKTDVAAAFTAGTGGVSDWESPSTSARENVFLVNYAEGDKQLRIDINVGTGGGAEADSAGLDTPISGNQSLYPDGTGHLDFDFATNPLAQFGITGHRTDRNGDWTLTAHFSDGQTASVTTSFDSTNDDEDTFFGFIAPEGESIVRVATSGASFIRTDDLGFIVPEPGVAGLMLTGGSMLLLRRKR